MPTKLNKAGQQQNYVPQGNGDASGEYADNASGSNKHFTNFKQPETQKTFNDFKKTEETNNKTPIVEQPKEHQENLLLRLGSQTKADFYISLLTSGLSNSKTKVENEEEFLKLVKDAIAHSNEDALDIISSTMNRRPFEFTEDRFNYKNSYYYPLMNQIHIHKEGFDRGFEEVGSPIFHEIGHYINESGKIKEKEQWYYTNRKLTDARTIHDDNKSVADTLQEELDEFAKNKYAAKIRADKQKFVDGMLKEHGFTMKEFDNLMLQSRDSFQSEEWQNIKSAVKNDYDNGKFGSISDANKYLQTKLQEWKKTGSYKELFAEIEQKKPYYKNATIQWYKKTGINAVSDAWSSRTEHGFGLGHDREYYSKKNDGKSMLGDEMWANFFAAYTTNDTPILETTKKYFPRTYDKMVKLVEYMKGQ